MFISLLSSKLTLLRHDYCKIATIAVNYNKNKYFNCNSSSVRLLKTWNGDKNHYRFKQSSPNYWLTATIGTIGTIALYTYGHSFDAKENDNKTEESDNTKFGSEIAGLKCYTLKEVSQHNERSKRIWVSFRSGVYDITDFVDQHPGGDKILMGAGGALEPFWELYAVHKSDRILRMLEDYRIGNLAIDDREVPNITNDPYSTDPIRHPALRPSSVKPFNAEPPLAIIVESFITPNDLFFVRNHLPVPDVNPKDYALDIEGFGLKIRKTLTLNDLKSKFKKHKVIATIQCAGNRRSEMNKIKEVKGLSWGAAAISTAEWGGARLTDVLKECGLDFDDNRIKHVQFEGCDYDLTASPYSASITADVALDPKSEFLLAYEMNGEDIPRDHGFPIRLIAPGIVGARNVKWLERIILSDEESDSHWQKRDNKAFSPNVNWENVDFDKSPPIQETPVQSVICDPCDGQSVSVDSDGQIKIRGYAWSGGGKKIIRVDVSADNGKNWITADLKQEPSPMNRTWAWTLWNAKVPLEKGWKKGDRIVLICKAIDSQYNVQPEDFAPIWNFGGFLGNAWSKVHVKIQ